MDKIEVMQADRKAAASYHNQRGEHVTADFITKGERDDGYLVQAFARHRLATHPPATDVAALVEAAKTMLPTDPRLAGKLPDDAIAPLNVWGSELNAFRQALAPFTKGQNDDA